MENINKIIKRFDIILFAMILLYTLYFIINLTTIIKELSSGGIVVHFLILSGICSVLALTYINLSCNRNAILHIFTFVFLTFSILILATIIPFIGHSLADNDILSMQNYRIYSVLTRYISTLTFLSFILKYLLEIYTVIKENYIISVTKIVRQNYGNN